MVGPLDVEIFQKFNIFIEKVKTVKNCKFGYF